MKALFLRRRKLGLGSVKGMTSVFPESFTYARNDRLHRADLEGVTHVIRWGCTSATGLTGVTLINTPEAIHRVNSKRSFAKTMAENGGLSCWNDINEIDFSAPCILRPERHAQGKNVFLINDMEGFLNAVQEVGHSYYVRPFINKVKEYRVYVMCGRVVTVAEKTPANPDAIAWNVAQGGRFDVLRWGLWPANVCEEAVKMFHLSGLHFSGVDVMVDEDGKAYVIELNSAPSLPALSDGSVSYRQKAMAKAFKWHLDNGFDSLSLTGNEQGYRRYIHPASIEV